MEEQELKTKRVAEDVKIREADDFASGTLIDEKFKIISVLGHGGMGTVYKVEQLLLKRDFALKTMIPGEVSDNSWRRFQKEAQAISKLNHANIVRAYEFGILAGGQPYLLMDLAEGETLGERIKRAGQLSLREALDLFIPICFGLAYAHGEGVIHRDIKPSNIILASGSKAGAADPKILDFGIAKVLGNEDATTLTKRGEVFGTPFYMSPEQCRGEQIDARCDIYSLGCVMFEALTGTPPFPGNSAVSIIAQHLGANPPTLKDASMGADFPPAIEQIIAKMLAKNPADRMQRADQVARSLIEIRQALLDGSRASSRKTEGKTVVGHKRERSRFPVVALLALAFGVLAGMGISNAIRTERPPEKTVVKLDESELSNTLYTGRGEKIEVGEAYSRPTGVKSMHSFALPKDAEGITITWATPESVEELRPGQPRRTFNTGSVVAKIDPIWAGLNPSYLMRFRPDDINEFIFDSEQVEGSATHTLGRVALAALPEINNFRVLHLCGPCFDNDALALVAHRAITADLWIDETDITGDAIAKMDCIPKIQKLTLVHVDNLSPLLRKVAQSNKNIDSLWLKRCSLTPQDLQEIGKLTNLSTLGLEDVTGVNARTVQALAKLPRLDLLDMSRTPIDDGVCEKIITLPALRSLTLRNTGITDASAHSIAKMQNLRDLVLCDTRLTDASMPIFATMPKLQKMEIQGSKITPSSMPSFKRLGSQSLRELKVTDDRMTGTDEWGPCSKQLAQWNIKMIQGQVRKGMRAIKQDPEIVKDLVHELESHP